MKKVEKKVACTLVIKRSANAALPWEYAVTVGDYNKRGQAESIDAARAEARRWEQLYKAQMPIDANVRRT